MNALDAVIIVAATSAAVGGYRLGFLARAASWVGLALGLYLSARFLPGLVNSVAIADEASRFLFAAFVLVVGAFAGQALGLLVGTRARVVLPPGPLRGFDHGVGAFLGAAGVIVAVWLVVLPSMVDAPGWPSRQARNSAVARALDRLAPRPPDTLQALRRLVGDASFPRVFEQLRPSPNVGPPPADSGLTPQVVATVSASTVKVDGVACRRVQEGSGFTAEPDTVVTNAHVVAGERQTFVTRPDGRRLAATVVHFDSDRDLAVLRVPRLGQQPLRVGGTVDRGTRGAVFGHPNGQTQLRVAPASVEQQVDAVGRDLYDRHSTRRDVLILAANLQPGDSGGALVDPGGAVVGVAFAIAPDRPGTAYALTTKELNTALTGARASAGRVSTGDCLAG